MFARRTVSTVFLGVALLASPCVLAADTTAPSATSPAGLPPPPSPAAVVAADQLLIAMGVKQTIATTVPTMLAELEQNVTKTQPDLRDPLRQTLKAIQPQFDASAKDMYEKAEALLTVDMTDKELQDTASFFGSPTGKKFLATQPIFFQQLGNLLDPWRQKMSTDIVAKARDELKKKGIDF